MVRRNAGFIGTDGINAPDPPTGVTVTASSTGGVVSDTSDNGIDNDGNLLISGTAHWSE